MLQEIETSKDVELRGPSSDEVQNGKVEELGEMETEEDNVVDCKNPKKIESADSYFSSGSFNTEITEVSVNLLLVKILFCLFMYL